MSRTAKKGKGKLDKSGALTLDRTIYNVHPKVQSFTIKLYQEHQQLRQVAQSLHTTVEKNGKYLQGLLDIVNAQAIPEESMELVTEIENYLKPEDAEAPVGPAMPPEVAASKEEPEVVEIEKNATEGHAGEENTPEVSPEADAAKDD